MTTDLTALSLLAAMTADNVEDVLGPLADLLEESGRLDLAQWCRQCDIRPGPAGRYWVGHEGGLPFPYPFDTLAAARAELLRRVVAYLVVPCKACRVVIVGRTPQHSAVMQFSDGCEACHGRGYTGLRPPQVPCQRCSGKGKLHTWDPATDDCEIYDCPACRGTGTVTPSEGGQRP